MTNRPRSTAIALISAAAALALTACSAGSLGSSDDAGGGKVT